MAILHLVAILTATGISPISIERANAWVPLRIPVVALSRPPPLALVENRWGTPYVNLAGTVNADGSILFLLTDVLDNIDSVGSGDKELRGLGISTEEPATTPPT